jgi:hypothetical protein
MSVVGNPLDIHYFFSPTTLLFMTTRVLLFLACLFACCFNQKVAVLSRNVILEGDPTSAQYQFGASLKANTPSVGFAPSC